MALALASDPVLPGPFYRRRWYRPRFGPDGEDLEALPTRVRELSLEARSSWEPDHPETSVGWMCHRVLMEYAGAYSRGDVEALLPEEIADAIEALQVANDVRLWQRGMKDG